MHQIEQGKAMNKLVYVSVLLVCAGCSRNETPSQLPAEPAPTAQQANAPVAKIDVPAGAYTLDKYHATLLFRVDHLGFSKYTGRFKTFDAQLQFDPENLAASSVNVTVDPKSLDVENPPAGFVDELIGASWLDTAQFPALTYNATSVEVTGANAVKITGDLTLHGITKPVVLDATFNGGYAGHPMDPQARIGFSAHGTFKRSDFGIAYGVPAPGTTMGVSDEVEVIVETEFSGPKWTPPSEENAKSQG
jgi:polyisoprenoid-binding protein YceI